MIAFRKAKSRSVDSRPIGNEEWNLLLTESAEGPPRMGSERRNTDRHRRTEVMNLQLGLRWFGKPKERYLVRTRDVSRTGIGFLHSQEIQQGTRCRLSMLTVKSRLIEVEGKVAYCHAKAEGVYSLGVEFDKALTLIDLVPATPPQQHKLKLAGA
ncbi:MAG: PilZ domain-containing protein [Planctomycetota bacterium]|nr:PilZ domain-containing protein [Planctomycetota bacterium]